ncbi:hypothetical protein DXT68_00195 [Microbacterium foliorum]|uniref:HAD-IA family hydrolase n=1 Tax=Microbacterium foliorum TaxID=104336 RepID=UPI000E20EBFA|nr:hypothetical protein DXT68_00195 [Microbacterium foliorum]
MSDWCFSAELGLTKPDAELYLSVAESIGAAPAEILYFDDVQRSVDAALHAGGTAHLWTSQPQGERCLRENGFVAEPSG